jgi:hypothetical protein
MATSVIQLAFTYPLATWAFSLPILSQKKISHKIRIPNYEKTNDQNIIYKKRRFLKAIY